MNNKSAAFFFGIILFLAFPFLYFWLLSTNHLPFLSSQETIFPVIIFVGVCFAFYIEKQAKHALVENNKYSIFLLGMTGFLFTPGFYFS